MPSKKHNQTFHTRKQMALRHGLTFGNDRRRHFISLIQKGKKGQADFVRRVSNSVTIWNIHHEGNIYQVVYNKNTHNIATVLPKTEAKGAK